MIHLHTLGDTLIKVGDKSIRPTSPLMFAALLYLGMERGRRVPRAALQELLFPKMDERSGAHSLRQLLYKLRQLGAPIKTDAAFVSVAEEQVHDDVTSPVATEQHVARFAGGFLPDYHPHHSERFSDWLEGQRQLVSRSIRRQLVAAIEESRESLDWQAVERHAVLLESVDPFNEVGVLARAEAAALLGGKNAAMELLERYEADTGRSDVRLPATLLRRRIASSVREPPIPFASVPFKGRDGDVKEIRRLVARARNGKPTLLVIGGEPGIGKTRLVSEATALAALEGIAVHTIRCHSHYSGRPLGVFIELVPVLRALRGALGISPESMSRLSSLTQHTDGPTSLADARDSLTRSELLLTAVHDLIRAVASEQPVLICVEDAHWADAESLKELTRCVHGAADHSVMVICTTRTPDAFPFLAARDNVVIRRLKPLADDAMSELAQHLLPDGDASDSTGIAGWCVDTASGNPLFLQMLCAHYASTRQASIPPDMISTISHRIEQLPIEARRLLELVAMLGRHATIENIRALSESSPATLVAALTHLEEHGYVEEDGAVLHAHGLMGDCVLRMVPPASRRLLHGYVASTLETRYETTRDAAILWDCAEQWRQSGEIDKAVDFLRRCSRHAMAIGAASDALALLETARTLAVGRNTHRDVLGDYMLAARASFSWDLASDAALEFDSLPCVGGAQHNDFELVSIDASWHARLDGEGAASRALVCLAEPTATNEHRADAARILLTVAQERCDAALAQQAYAAVASLIDTNSFHFSSRQIPMFYHSLFGDREQTRKIGRDVIRALPGFAVPERMRMALNIVTSFMFAGINDEASDLAQRYTDFAESVGASTWVHDFATVTCVCHVNAEDFRTAQQWFDRAEMTAPAKHRGSISMMRLTNRLELAIGACDKDAARLALAPLKGITGLLRFAAYLLGATVRVHQLNPDYVCSSAEIDEMRGLQVRVRQFGSADSIVTALCEALLRAGRAAEALQTVSEYVVYRREGTCLPPSLESRRQRAVDTLLAAHV